MFIHILAITRAWYSEFNMNYDTIILHSREVKSFDNTTQTIFTSRKTLWKHLDKQIKHESEIISQISPCLLSFKLYCVSTLHDKIRWMNTCTLQYYTHTLMFALLFSSLLASDSHPYLNTRSFDHVTQHLQVGSLSLTCATRVTRYSVSFIKDWKTTPREAWEAHHSYSWSNYTWSIKPYKT